MREIAHNQIAIGYFHRVEKISIYTDGTCCREVSVPASAFGIILPPPQDPKWNSTLEGDIQPTLIVLDNNRFFSVDLNKKEGENE